MTSSLPGEGKTTLALALAQSFAGLETNVLLIEGDIRRRILGTYVRARARHGLVSVLEGQATLEEAVWRDRTLGVDLLLGQKSAGSAADLFSSECFAELVAQARRRYDAVVIDTPPVLPVPDARVIAPQADALLFVVRWDATSALQVGEALKLLDEAGPRIRGLALNRIDLRGMRRYGYGGRHDVYGHRYAA